MIKRGDEVTLRLEGAAVEGKCIARMDGLVVFVRGGVPGDTARVRITKVKKQFLEADFRALEQPSPDRVQARCRYFGVCGGCTSQELHYDAQLQSKRRSIVDALERIGGLVGVEVLPAAGAVEIYWYRNKMEFSFGERWLTVEEMARGADELNGEQSRFALGLHLPGRFDKVLDLEECWLQSEASVRIVNATRRFALAAGLGVHSTRTHEGYLRNLVIREGRRTGERMVNLVTFDDRPDVMRAYTESLLAEVPEISTVVNNMTERKSQVAFGDVEKVYYGPGSITEKIGGRTYRISANSFFQTNTAQAERLYDVALEMAALTGSETVYDLYSGTGTIALHLAGFARQVVGIETVPQAIDDANSNAAFNNVANCTFLLGDLKERLTRDTAWTAHHAAPDVVVIDPPRSGMHEAVARQVLHMGASRIVYVSCNPATQARDLKILVSTGRYRVNRAQPVDMFPHTSHVENVALLEAAL